MADVHVSDTDVILWSDSDGKGGGDIILGTGSPFVERARVSAQGIGTGLLAVPTPAVAVRRHWQPESYLATLIATFASGHGWTVAQSSTGGSQNLNDTANPGPFAAQSAKFAVGNTGTTWFQKTGLALDLTGKSLLVWVRYTDANANAPGIQVVMGDAGLAANWTSALFDPPVAGVGLHAPESGWVCFEFFPAAMTKTGTPAISAVDTIRIQIGSTAGVNPIWVGGVASRSPSSVYSSGVVTFSFDDANASDFTLARPTLAAYNLPATAYVIADAVGNTGPTIAQYHQMQDELGWEIAGHAYTTADHNARFENLTTAQLVTDLSSLRGWMLDNGFTSESLASPGGTAGNTCWSTIRDYFNCVATAGVGGNGLLAYQGVTPVRPYNLMRGTWDTSQSTVAGFKAAIDEAITNKTWLIFNFHSVTSVASSGENISTSDLDSIASYAAGSGIAIRTVEQVLRESSLR